VKVLASENVFAETLETSEIRNFREKRTNCGAVDRLEAVFDFACCLVIVVCALIHACVHPTEN